jgi:hypothetical protein
LSGKTKAELQVENRMLRRSRVVESVAAVVQTGIKWGALFGIFYWLFRSVEVLAGQHTLAQIGVGFWADVRISEALAWLLAVLFGGYGIGQRKLRKDTIERLSARVKELETQIDPGRTSSRLTSRGDTHPGDRI